MLCLIVLSVCTEVTVAQEQDTYYRFRRDIKAQYEKDSTGFAMQMEATDYSINGFYRDALDVFQPHFFSISDKDLQHFDAADWNPVNAREYILRRARDEQVVVINEAHHCSRNRHFTASLLAGLYQEGYRYLGLEALIEGCDSALNRRGYVVWNDGFYTREPEFGNLIHEALALGFTVFGYEVRGKTTADGRERGQVGNILDFLSAHPVGKTLIHCGYDHVNEYRTQPARRAMMAELLRDTLGMDILTISQSRSVEGRLPVRFAGADNMPVVLLDPSGKPFAGVSTPQTDMWVVYPPTEYIHRSRPLWQTYGRQPYRLDVAGFGTFPVLVLVYRAGERDGRGTPADILQLDGEEDPPLLYLKPGKYEYVVYDSAYEQVESGYIDF